MSYSQGCISISRINSSCSPNCGSASAIDMLITRCENAAYSVVSRVENDPPDIISTGTAYESARMRANSFFSSASDWLAAMHRKRCRAESSTRPNFLAARCGTASVAPLLGNRFRKRTQARRNALDRCKTQMCVRRFIHLKNCPQTFFFF